MSKEILQAAINKYGAHNQIDMLHEEIGELMQAINKMKRFKAVEGNIFQKPHQFSPVEYVLNYNQLCSEIADVKIMLGQLELMVSADHVKLSYERKIERLKNNLGL